MLIEWPRPSLQITRHAHTRRHRHARTVTRIALVTGGGRGLGRSTVLALAARGVALHPHLQHQQGPAADEVVAQAEQAGVKASRAPARHRRGAAAFPGFVEEVRRLLGRWGAERLDCLVNNAGTSHRARHRARSPRRTSTGSSPHPRQGRALPHPGAAAADQRRRPDREPVVGAHPHHLSRAAPPTRAMKGAVEVLTTLHGEGARGPSPDRRQRRWRRAPSRPTSAAAWSATTPTINRRVSRGDGARPARPAGRHRPDDRLAAVRRTTAGSTPSGLKSREDSRSDGS